MNAFASYVTISVNRSARTTTHANCSSQLKRDADDVYKALGLKV